VFNGVNSDGDTSDGGVVYRRTYVPPGVSLKPSRRRSLEPDGDDASDDDGTGAARGLPMEDATPTKGCVPGGGRGPPVYRLTCCRGGSV
jgi:hypothetical protein